MKILPYLVISLFVSVMSAAQPVQIKPGQLASTPVYFNGGGMVVNDIAVGSDGSVVAVGNYYNTVDFAPGTDTVNVSVDGYTDIFIAKYDKGGRLVYVHHFGNHHTSWGTAYSVALDEDNNAYVTGNFNDTIDFNPGAGSAILSGKSTEAFIASYDKNGVYRYASKITDTRDNIVRTQVSRSIAVDKLRNVYVTGSFRHTVDFDPGTAKHYLNAVGTRNIFIAKYDSAGRYVFAKNIAGAGEDEAQKLVLDKSGNIALCGYITSGYADFDPGPDTVLLKAKGQEDIFFAKYDKRGNYLFAKSIGGLKYDRANSIAAGTDNSLVITGHFAGRAIDFDPGKDTFYLYSSDTRAYQCFVAKYDSSGNFNLAFTIGNNDNEDDGKGVATDSANNIIVIGTFPTSDVDFDPGAGVYNLSNKQGQTNFIAKYTAAGAFVFADAIGNTRPLRNYSYTDVNCVRTDAKGNIYTGAGFADTLDVDPGPKLKRVYEPALSLLVSKYNAGGEYLNSFNVNNYYDYYNRSSQLSASATDAEGNVYTSGIFNGLLDFDPGPGVYALESKNDYRSAGFFAKYDKKGNIMFAKAISGSFGYLYDMAVDKDGAIYVTGYATGFTDFDPSDSVQYWNGNKTFSSEGGHFFAKYSKEGNLVFAKGFNAEYGNDIAEAIAVDKQKNIYVAGYFYHKIDFDPGTGSHLLTAAGRDIFLSKYDSLGNYVFAFNIGSRNGYDEATDVKINSGGDVLLCGHLEGDQVDFDPGPGQFLLSSGTSYFQAGFVSVYKNDGWFVNAFSLRQNDNTGYDFSIRTLLVDEATDHFYITGTFNGKIDFNPGTGTNYIRGTSGMYIASYTKNNQLRFVKGSDKPVYAISVGGIAPGGMALDKQKNIYTTGSFSVSRIDLDFGPDTAILVNEHPDETNGFNTDIFIAKYDSIGNYIYSYDLDGDSAIGPNAATTIQVDDENRISVGGYCQTKIDFDPGSDTLFLHPIPNARQTLYLVSYTQLAATVKAAKNTSSVADQTKKASAGGQFSVYPNPVSNRLFISIKNITEASGKAQVAVYDNKGVCVMKNPVAVTNHRVDASLMVSALPAGTYFIQVNTATQACQSSFMVR